MVVSQDKDEIWFTIAYFDDYYVEYVRQGTISKENDEQDRGFLEMEEFGPFNTGKSDHMKILGQCILAFVLEHCDVIESEDT